MKHRRAIVYLFLSLFLFAVPRAEAVDPVFDHNKGPDVNTMLASIASNEMTKQATSLLGVESIDAMKGLTDIFKVLLDLFGQFGDFSFDFQSILSGLFEDMMSNPFDSGSVSSETAKKFSNKEFRGASASLAEDVKKKIGEMSDKIAGGGGSAGGLIGGLGEESGENSKEIAKKVLEDIGEHYFASYPGVQEEAFRRVQTNATSVQEAGIGARSFGEEVRARAQKKGIDLRTPYIKDDDEKNEYDKKVEKVMESEQEITERLQKDVSKAGNELEILRMIAAMTAALVQRQENTNILLTIQIDQANDRAEILSHTATMLAESYGKSVETGIRRQVDMSPKRRAISAAVRAAVASSLILCSFVPATFVACRTLAAVPASAMRQVYDLHKEPDFVNLAAKLLKNYKKMEMLRAQDFESFIKGLFGDLQGMDGGDAPDDSHRTNLFGLSRENTEKRKEVVEAGKDVGSPTVYEKDGMRSAAAEALGLHSSISYIYKAAATLGEDSATTSIMKYLSDEKQSQEKYKETLKDLEQHKRNVEPQSKDILAALDALGLGQDAMAIVRQILLNLIEFEKEKMITNVLESELSRVASEHAVLASEEARIHAARYADAVEVGFRDRSTGRPVTGAPSRTRE